MKLKNMVMVGVMAAIIFVATWIHIPIQIGYASMIHLGTAALLIVAVILEPKEAFLAAAIGMGLFDVMDPAFVVWAPFTFVIKGLMAFVVSYYIHKKPETALHKLIAFALGSVISIGGYYLAGCIIIGDMITPISHIPSAVTTSIIGIILAMPLSAGVKASLKSIDKSKKHAA